MAHHIARVPNRTCLELVFFVLLVLLPAILVRANEHNAEHTANNLLNSQTVSVLGESFQNNNATAGAYINVVDYTLIVESSTYVPSDIATTEGGVTGSVITTYSVQQGDNLSKIAEKFSVSINTIVWANDLRKSTIQVGQELIILPISGVRHTVVSGDTLSSLAKKYNADSYDIESYNGFDSTQKLIIGQEITVPYGSIPKPKVVVRTTSNSSSQRKVWNNGVFTSGLRNISGPNYDNYYTAPISGTRSRGLHGNNAVDWAAPKGTPVYAVAAGVVKIAKNSGYNGGYGKYVVINHSNNTQTLYSHLSSTGVTSGQLVSAKQMIGRVGTTGNSSGNHLHFEVRGAQNPWR